VHLAYLYLAIKISNLVFCNKLQHCLTDSIRSLSRIIGTNHGFYLLIHFKPISANSKIYYCHFFLSVTTLHPSLRRQLD
jgi:hypothetical protein